jgi:hypothetical protein
MRYDHSKHAYMQRALIHDKIISSNIQSEMCSYSEDVIRLEIQVFALQS